ncbi:uncharacterized protein PRCAT00000716001 [Priceomyces carsonii]|uniref:uncharacterized protein n=1 Tax=Priceomyces carsonii TaxID=28549 RepID=UPI002ED852E9|nr:unnamed protein product [Priceomyces carsonii]
MKLSKSILGLAVLSLVHHVRAELIQGSWFPVDFKGSIPVDFSPFVKGEQITIDCSARNIDNNGEHKFDDKLRVIYTAFPTCKESGKPLEFKYGINEDLQCTIEFTDEIYHLFQLYIHEDAPFSCRLPTSSSTNYLEQGGAYVPLTFNLRGEVRESHLRIDNNINVIIVTPSTHKSEQNTFISAVGWSSGTNLTRIKIGDELPLKFAIRWFDQLDNEGSLTQGMKNIQLPYADGFYKLPNPRNAFLLRWLLYFPLQLVMLVVYFTVFALTLGGLLFFYFIIKKSFRNNRFGSFDSETGYNKND